MSEIEPWEERYIDILEHDIEKYTRMLDVMSLNSPYYEKLSWRKLGLEQAKETFLKFKPLFGKQKPE